MEKRKISWTVVLLLGCLELNLVSGCSYTTWVKKFDSCAKYHIKWSDWIVVYKDVMPNGESRMLCCPPNDPLIATYTKKASSCTMRPCTTSPSEVNCPIRTIRGKKANSFDEILREKCTTAQGKAGYTSLCCPENSKEGLQAAAMGAESNEFPHMAKLKLTGHCGGTIYNKRFIITAAHCIVDKKTYRLNPASQMKAIIGSNSGDIEDPQYVYQVKKAIPHEKYSRLYPNSETMKKYIINDIALLELDRDIEFGPNVKALQIAEPDFEPSDYADQAVIAGWGTTDLGAVSAHLNRVNVRLRNQENCFGTYNNPTTRRPQKAVWNSHKEYRDQLLCHGGVLEGKWSPRSGPGDSGGPAICRGPDGHPVLCGLTSFGRNATECIQNPNSESFCPPSVNVRVSYFNDWIKEHAGEPADEQDIYKPYLYGQPVSKGRYDHQVHITSATGKPCGGTLISPDVVVTAASCIAMDDGTEHDGIKVHYGLYDLENEKPVKTFGVASTEILDGFQMVGEKVDVKKQGHRVRITDNFYKNNLAAIKLDGKAPIGANKLIGLPGKGKMFEEGTEIAFPRKIGGKFRHGGKLSSRDFNILEKDECQKRMTRLAQGRSSVKGVSMKVSGDVLCGIEKYSGGSQCDRELGGGLICKGKNGKDVLCGVQVFRLCEFSIPNGFMDMSQKLDWVKTAMERL